MRALAAGARAAGDRRLPRTTTATTEYAPTQTTSVQRAQTRRSRQHAEHDYRQAELRRRCGRSATTRSKLTGRPPRSGAADAEELRAHGWDDAAIHDAIQVIAYFNYINRIAEGVGIGAGARVGPGEGS